MRKGGFLLLTLFFLFIGFSCGGSAGSDEDFFNTCLDANETIDINGDFELFSRE